MAYAIVNQMTKKTSSFIMLLLQVIIIRDIFILHIFTIFTFIMFFIFTKYLRNLLSILTVWEVESIETLRFIIWMRPPTLLFLIIKLEIISCKTLYTCISSFNMGPMVAYVMGGTCGRLTPKGITTSPKFWRLGENKAWDMFPNK